MESGDSKRYPQSTGSSDGVMRALRIFLRGRVQGCGVRPAVVLAARRWGVRGWVANVGDHVRIHAEADAISLDVFRRRLLDVLPPEADVTAITCQDRPASFRLTDFVIRQPRNVSVSHTLPDLPPDTGICSRCIIEINDPDDRRYRYPFTHCATCGPRYSWLRELPFVRANTTLASHPLCEACEREMTNPRCRRFGAELMTCPNCGPRLRWQTGTVVESDTQALDMAIAHLNAGRLIAVQGMSGFHLMARCDAADAIALIREVKCRPRKPLAMMVRDLDQAAEFVTLTPAEANALQSARRPVVVVRSEGDTVPSALAPGLDTVGLLLPASALHWLLVDAAGPLVATSANRRGEPLAATADALTDWPLAGILSHDVELWIPQDDSVECMIGDQRMLLRRARGWSHLALAAQSYSPSVQRAQGAWQKNTVAWQWGARILVSPPFGERDVLATEDRREQVTRRIEHLCGIVPSLPAYVDAHPDSDAGIPIPHHQAHVAALLLDAGDTPPDLVAAWDGLGYVSTSWLGGSEVFAPQGARWRAVTGLMPYALPGGDHSHSEPWRVTVELLIQSGIDRQAVRQWLAQRIPRFSDPCTAQDVSTRCSGMGRWFEALACLILGEMQNYHEGDIASVLEARARSWRSESMPLPTAHIVVGDAVHWNWRPLVQAVWRRMHQGESPASLGRALHVAMIDWLWTVCDTHGAKVLGVTGGCFQNCLLLDLLMHGSEARGLHVMLPRQLPPNDEAVSAGQLRAGA